MNAKLSTIETSLTRAAVGLALAMLMVLTLGSPASAGPCSKTSSVMFISCGSDARDDYWEGIGNCINQHSDRKECREEAREERRENADLCGEQFDAREDVCDGLGQKRYDPEMDPDDFVSPAEAAADPNPFFPLIPGAEWVYEGDGEEITVTVLAKTREILGIECTVVQDIVTEDGELVEDTDDWYAQDKDGNVWYMGEISRNYEDGELTDVDGSWEGGVDGAKPGILMWADPQVGAFYRQEFALGEAEDMGEVVSLTANESSPAASCSNNCLATEETTPIEPDTLEYKYYVPGVGLILEADEDGEVGAELVSYSIP